MLCPHLTRQDSRSPFAHLHHSPAVFDRVMARAKRTNRTAPSPLHRRLAGRIQLDPLQYHNDPTPGYEVLSVNSAIVNAGLGSVAEKSMPGDDDGTERAEDKDSDRIVEIRDDSEDEDIDDVVRSGSVNQPTVTCLTVLSMTIFKC